jgi:hypothetical protein
MPRTEIYCAAAAYERPEEACPSYIRFNLRDIDRRQVPNRVEANWEHSPPTIPDYYEMACSHLSTDQIAVAHEISRSGAAAAAIRARRGVAIHGRAFPVKSKG